MFNALPIRIPIWTIYLLISDSPAISVLLMYMSFMAQNFQALGIFVLGQRNPEKIRQNEIHFEKKQNEVLWTPLVWHVRIT